LGESAKFFVILIEGAAFEGGLRLAEVRNHYGEESRMEAGSVLVVAV
jgi:hypothetical protein